MVLAIYKKVALVVAVFLINAAIAFPFVSPSGLVQYGENIDRERLELMENRQTVRFVEDGFYSIIGTYIVRNSGSEYQSTLGILFYGLGTLPSYEVTEIQFFVDGKQVQHTEREYLGKFVMGETTSEFTPGRSTAWALIDVAFPQNSTVEIRVQYRASFSVRGDNTWLSYNSRNTFYQGLSYWKGTPKFSIEIVNAPNDGARVAGSWISSIEFSHIEDRSKNIDTREYLQGLQSLETDLMNIQRPNGNTIRINFTERFMDNYQKSFIIQTREWVPGPNAYFRQNYPEREIILWFLRTNSNISQRILSPYELIFLTSNQLRIMRNLFFARHGFIFQSREMQDVFNSLEYFYQPNPNFHEGMLTDIDRANIAIIQRLEALVGE